ncbi:hypothetical protein [Azoarcus sp. DN11]|uniref:hypothetical protein n=1 Tax=Azoarcus sp. DN11 TaxID=356837 RepID=UPI000FE1A351|nr:hypothetical protein [Azoarcus sp. DN11]
MMKRRAMSGLVSVAALLAGCPAQATDHAWPVVRGRALADAFTGQDFGDGVHYAYQFLPSGELRGVDMGEPTRGRWRVTASQLCWRWTYAAGQEECYQVRKQEHHVRLFANSREMLAGTLTPLNANGSIEVKP